jgi:hypothetical protein
METINVQTVKVIATLITRSFLLKALFLIRVFEGEFNDILPVFENAANFVSNDA